MNPPPALQKLPVEGPYSQRAFALWGVEQLVPDELEQRTATAVARVSLVTFKTLLQLRVGSNRATDVDLENHQRELREGNTAIRVAAFFRTARSHSMLQLLEKALTPGHVWRWTTTVDVFEMALDIVGSEGYSENDLAREAFAATCDQWVEDALRAFSETAAAVQAEDFLAGKQLSTLGHAPDQLGHCGCESCRATRDNLTLDNELFRGEDD